MSGGNILNVVREKQIMSIQTASARLLLSYNEINYWSCQYLKLTKAEFIITFVVTVRLQMDI